MMQRPPAIAGGPPGGSTCSTVIAGYVRTPFHFARKGALAGVRPDDLAGLVAARAWPPSWRRPDGADARRPAGRLRRLRTAPSGAT
jgi:hypothetical protein